MLTRAATALPVNPSSWYINRDRTKDMATGQGFLTSDGSAVGQQADVDTTRQTRLTESAIDFASSTASQCFALIYSLTS